MMIPPQLERFVTLVYTHNVYNIALNTPVETDTDSFGRCDCGTDRDDLTNTIYSLRIYYHRYVFTLVK